MPFFQSAIFAAAKPNHSSYLFEKSDFQTDFPAKQSLILPLAHDSEWNNYAIEDYLSGKAIQNRFHISTQVKHIYDKPVCFFTERAIKETGYDFLLPFETDFVVCDYLKQFGIESSIEYDESDVKLPYLDLYLYSFFGIVDIPLLAKPNSLMHEIIKTALSNNNIRHDKRLSTDWNRPVSCPITIYLSDINNEKYAYRLRLFFIDISAIHGNKGYKSVCQNVGIDVSAKSLMDDYKSDMLSGLKLYPQDFITYACGDLNIYDVLVAYNSMMNSVYNELGLGDYFVSPKLTIGATVADIVSATIFNWQDIPASEYHEKNNKKFKRKGVLHELMALSSAEYLRTQLVKSHVYLLGKIHGGRCHNNNPLIRHSMDTIADYDLAGAYSSIMAQLPFFIGKPWIYNGNGETVTLKEFLRRHESDFDDWHYVIYVSTNELLEYEQDFLVSWLDARVKKQRLKSDNGDYVYIPIADYNSGNCRIFKREIVNCPITSDTVKWIRSLSKQTRDDLMEKLQVKSAIGYRRNDKEWKSINLGELLINSLKQKRAYYKKEYKNTGNGAYNSMQELYKLVINTVYGVMCSRHFITSNVVVANQITQAIRLGMYLMEKGLNLQGSITDGCMGSLNKVVYPLGNRHVSLDGICDIYKYNTDRLGKKHIRLGALDNAKHIDLSWNDGKPQLKVVYDDRIEIIKNVNEWIDNKAWLHLKNLFPDFDYLFSFLKIETKDVYDSYIYHGAANYRLQNPNYTKHAMRGYSGKKDAIAITYDNDKIVKTDYYEGKSIPQVFLSQLENGIISQNPCFAKTKILKSKEYVERGFINRSALVCGDEVIEIGLPNYCSLSQYTFQTIKQYDEWKRQQNNLKRRYGESFEIFFTDKEGKLNYDLMCKVLCELIDSGNKTPIRYLEKLYYRKNAVSLRYLTKQKASELRNCLIFTNDENNDFGEDFEEGYHWDNEND